MIGLAYVHYLQEVPEAALNCGCLVEVFHLQFKTISRALFINVRFCFSLRTQVVTTFVWSTTGNLWHLWYFCGYFCIYLVSHLVPWTQDPFFCASLWIFVQETGDQLQGGWRLLISLYLHRPDTQLSLEHIVVWAPPTHSSLQHWLRQTDMVHMACL